jgi:ABC-type spermidine/putrescine transport system permease subunit II
MRRAYLLIVIPGVVVGIAYVILLHYIGVTIHVGPFLGAAAAFVAAVLIVRHFQKRKSRRHGSS